MEEILWSKMLTLWHYYSVFCNIVGIVKTVCFLGGCTLSPRVTGIIWCFYLSDCTTVYPDNVTHQSRIQLAVYFFSLEPMLIITGHMVPTYSIPSIILGKFFICNYHIILLIKCSIILWTYCDLVWQVLCHICRVDLVCFEWCPHFYCLQHSISSFGDCFWVCVCSVSMKLHGSLWF